MLKYTVTSTSEAGAGGLAMPYSYLHHKPQNQTQRKHNGVDVGGGGMDLGRAFEEGMGVVKTWKFEGL